jgi:hypothetical protein
MFPAPATAPLAAWSGSLRYSLLSLRSKPPVIADRFEFSCSRSTRFGAWAASHPNTRKNSALGTPAGALMTALARLTAVGMTNAIIPKLYHYPRRGPVYMQEKSA